MPGFCKSGHIYATGQTVHIMMYVIHTVHSITGVRTNYVFKNYL